MADAVKQGWSTVAMVLARVLGTVAIVAAAIDLWEDGINQKPA